MSRSRRQTPLFPEIAVTEGEMPAPFLPFVSMPRAAMYDPRLHLGDIRVLGLIVDDCNGMIAGSPSRKVESQLSDQQLSEGACVHINSVHRSLKRLVETGWLDRFTDRGARGAPRCLKPTFRTIDPPKKGTPEECIHPAPARGAPSAGAWCTQRRRVVHPAPALGAPSAGAGSLPTSSKTSEKTEEKTSDVTGVRTEVTRKADAGPAPNVEAGQASAPPVSVAELVSLAATAPKPTRRYYVAELAKLGLGPDGSPLGESSPGGPPPAPAMPPSPAPAAASAPAFDGAWARLMARAKTEQAPPPPAAPATRRDAPPARAAADPAGLARQLGAGPAAASRLAEDLGRRWRDRKPETLAFWASGLAEVSTGLLTADLVVGLIRDADRPGVRSRSREFSASLGKALVAARRAKNRPGCGLRSFTPAGAGKPTSPTTRDYTLNRGSCNARVAGS